MIDEEEDETNGGTEAFGVEVVFVIGAGVGVDEKESIKRLDDDVEPPMIGRVGMSMSIGELARLVSSRSLEKGERGEEVSERSINEPN